MTRLQEVLRDGDPLSREPKLDDTEARAMRRAVVAAAEQARAGWSAWRYAAAITVMAAVMLGVISTIAWREPAPPDDAPALAGLPPVEMQFSTPGGTRVIWVFDQSGAE